MFGQRVRRCRLYVVAPGRQAGVPHAGPSVVDRVRAARDLATILFYRSRVFVCEWNAVRLCARIRLERRKKMLKQFDFCQFGVAIYNGERI